MKPFNLEEAKAGKPVCTRTGHDVRIICFDRLTRTSEGQQGGLALVFLIKDKDKNGHEHEIYVGAYSNGKVGLGENSEYDEDLFMKSTTEKRWAIFWPKGYGQQNESIGAIYKTYLDARNVMPLLCDVPRPQIIEFEVEV